MEVVQNGTIYHVRVGREGGELDLGHYNDYMLAHNARRDRAPLAQSYRSYEDGPDGDTVINTTLPAHTQLPPGMYHIDEITVLGRVSEVS